MEKRIFERSISGRKFWMGAALGGLALAFLPSFAGAVVSTNYALELNGIDCGIVQGFVGGDIEGIVSATPQAYFDAKKIIGVKYNAFKIAIGAGMCPDVYKWIQTTLDGQGPRMDGSIRVLDSVGNELEVRGFQKAYLAAIAFPALNVASKTPGFLTLTFQSELSFVKLGSGQPHPLLKQKPFSTSSFMLNIDGVDSAQVTTIDALTVAQKVTIPGIDKVMAPPKVTFADLAIAMPEMASQTFQDWFQNSVVMAPAAASGMQKQGSLAFMDAGGAIPLIKLNLMNLGIYKGSMDLADSATDKTRVYRARMFAWNYGFAFTDAMFAKVKDKKSSGRMPASANTKSKK